MATMQTNYNEIETYRVIHPLDDEPETKCGTEQLGLMKMTRSVKFSLMVLRAYLAGMTLMLIYHVLHLAGVFTR
ncbi:MAG TPA: hypothetical protein VKZ53_18305 [Candidatus Angelobacter sp.]|nr:hypothetical protein [Candidatus Angelobacter sp.]